MTDVSASVIVAQLLFLEAEDPEKGIYETVYTLTEEGSWQLRIGAYPEFSGTEPFRTSPPDGGVPQLYAFRLRRRTENRLAEKIPCVCTAAVP